nr:MAG TPA: hypothetical protein [Caudoviricetes sp.]
MICKGCYHSDMCGFERCDDALTFCKDFKDKSRIIELPCKVGDVFYIIAQRFEKGKYTDFFIDSKQISCFEYDGKSLSACDYEGINIEFKNVYFDKSEAEAKLKELNKNEQIVN